MKISKLDYYILSSPFDDLIKWAETHSEIIHKYEDAFTNRIVNLIIYEDCNSNDLNSISLSNAMKLLSVLFTNTPELDESIFRLIKKLTKRLIDYSDTVLDDDLVMLCFVSLDFNDILTVVKREVSGKSILEYLCNNVMNIYIPSSNPKLIVDTFINNFEFIDIINNISNTEWFFKECESKKLSAKIQIGPMLVLFKYIADIISYDQEKIAYLEKVKNMNANGYINRFNHIADFYKKFFGNDIECFIADAINLIYDEEDSIDIFLSKWSNEYKSKVKPAMLRCILNDIQMLIQQVSDSSYLLKFDEIKNVLVELWGNEKYDVTENEQSFDELLPDDTPISCLESIAIEAVHKDAPVMDAASKKIYKAYRTYKSAEEKVDSQLSKAVGGIKRCLTGDVRTQIIEGKEFSPIGLLKKVLGTVAIFSYSKVAGILTIVVGHALKKKTTQSERTKIIMELDTEIAMITEKIEDARGDGNREAKYAMMRTKRELENAKRKIQYGIEADDRSTKGAKKLLDSVRR